jgi:hypothetical protein
MNEDPKDVNQAAKRVEFSSERHKKGDLAE